MSKKTIMIGFPNEKLNLFWTWNLPNPFSLIGLSKFWFWKGNQWKWIWISKRKKKKKTIANISFTFILLTFAFYLAL